MTKILETIKTTKGAYSLTFQIRERDNETMAMVSIECPNQHTFMRLDAEDLRRIKLLISDHLEDG